MGNPDYSTPHLASLRKVYAGLIKFDPFRVINSVIEVGQAILKYRFGI
jgi:hypothetical protein